MDNVNEKIALIEEQIENLERSGYFTEKEIDRLSFPLRNELESLKKHFYLPIELQYNEPLDNKLIQSLKYIWNKAGRNLEINKG